jgi:hypothetical protein
MQKVRKVLKNRALLTLLAIAMVWGSFTFMLVPKANACQQQDVEFTYYTDWTKTVVCGYEHICCYCMCHDLEGCFTAYRTIHTSPCS